MTDPQTAAEIRFDVAAGKLAIGALRESEKGARADANTLAIKFSDKPTHGQVATRLQHEQIHRKRTSDAVLSGSPFSPVDCEEAEVFTISYNHMLMLSCAETVPGPTGPITVGPVSCERLEFLWQAAWDYCELCPSMHDCLDVVGLFSYGCCPQGG